MESGRFTINKEKGTVVYFLKSKGEKFVGVARTAAGDVFDEEVGKALAGRRVDIQVRRRDLAYLEQAKCELEYLAEAWPDIKLYKVYLADAIEVVKDQKRRIAILKKEIECLENGLPIPKRVFAPDRQKVYKTMKKI